MERQANPALHGVEHTVHTEPVYALVGWYCPASHAVQAGVDVAEQVPTSLNPASQDGVHVEHVVPTNTLAAWYCPLLQVSHAASDVVWQATTFFPASHDGLTVQGVHAVPE